jgi:hypothetical protein
MSSCSGKSVFFLYVSASSVPLDGRLRAMRFFGVLTRILGVFNVQRYVCRQCDGFACSHLPMDMHSYARERACIARELVSCMHVPCCLSAHAHMYIQCNTVHSTYTHSVLHTHSTYIPHAHDAQGKKKTLLNPPFQQKITETPAPNTRHGSIQRQQPKKKNTCPP